MRVRGAGVQVRWCLTDQDDFGAGVGDELEEEEEEDDDDPPDDDPLDEVDAAAPDFSAGFAAGDESDLLSDLVALFSADSDDLPLDSARESLR